MKSKLSPEILEKYFKGDCNEAEIAEIRAWYASFEPDLDDISALPREEVQLLKQLMWSNISDNIESNNVVDIDRRRSLWRSVIYWVSSSAAILLVLFLVKQQGTRPNTVASHAREPLKEAVSNTAGVIKKITLSDGSTVWLSPKSALTYLQKFTGQKREVTLTGEAFFEVTKDSNRPFSIYSGNVITKVWGTSFRVRSFTADKTTKVNVLTGKVSVAIAVPKETRTDLNNEVMLLPNQEAVYDKNLGQLQKNDKIKDVSIGMWKKANLSFNNTQLRDVFKVLSKSFNVKISSDDERINSDYLKADFTNENLPAIMEILQTTLNVTYSVRNENEFILEGSK
ncbi:FecR family protein [Mucilaginibacter sp.]|jgi:ferric-dicitrate binding protein FerR (iron transport regulator)|uniref:FecR family protein n=1 Tax=Mucilaginibacter sp. TaxID=1882438 RepID=UPI00356A98E1